METTTVESGNVKGRELPLGGVGRSCGIDPANCQRCAKAIPDVSLQASLSLAFFEFVVGVTSGSVSLLADAMNSTGAALDSGATQILAKRSSRPADGLHPFGHGKVLPVGTFFLNVLLLLLGVGIVVAAILAVVLGKVTRPRPVAIAGALVAVGARLILRDYFQCVAGQNESGLVLRWVLAVRGEAFASLVVLGGVAGAVLFHPILDPLAAVAVGVLRGWSSFSRLPDVAQSLLDRSLGPRATAIIEQRALSHAGVVGIHEIRSRRIGDSYWVEVGIEVAADLAVRDAESVAESLRSDLERNPDYRHVEIRISPYGSQRLSDSP